MTFIRLCGAALLVVSLGSSAACDRALTPSSPTPVASTAVVQSIPGPSGAVPGAITGKSIDINVSLVEFQYAAGPNWYYAPQVHFDAGSEASATLTGFSFSIPGLPGTMQFCTALQVPAGMQFDLFHEIYGDYELTIDNPGLRATGPTATAMFTLNDSGATTTRTIQAPIVLGTLPKTYSGNYHGGPWQICR